MNPADGYTFETGALSKTMVRNTSSDLYIIVAEAESDRDEKYSQRKIGDTFRVVWGEVRGMTDNGQPGWTEYGAYVFKTVEEANVVLPHLSNSLYSGKIIAGSVKVRRRVTRTIEYLDEYDLDEAQKIIDDSRASFREYMQSR
jgi:hypothetical protein